MRPCRFLQLPPSHRRPWPARRPRSPVPPCLGPMRRFLRPRPWPRSAWARPRPASRPPHHPSHPRPRTREPIDASGSQRMIDSPMPRDCPTRQRSLSTPARIPLPLRPRVWPARTIIRSGTQTPAAPPLRKPLLRFLAHTIDRPIFLLLTCRPIPARAIPRRLRLHRPLPWLTCSRLKCAIPACPTTCLCPGQRSATTVSA